MHSSGLTLALLVLRVLLVDDVNLSLPSYDLAIGGTFFDGSSDFHGTVSFLMKKTAWFYL